MDMMTKLILFIAIVIMDVVAGIVAVRVLTKQGKQEQVKLVLIVLAMSTIAIGIILFALL